jgi:ParB family chromosome partitioning protein
LFDDSNSGYVQDIALLNQLVDSKLQNEVETIKAQDWQWVEVVQEIDWKFRSQFSSLKPTLRELSTQENQELDRLFTEYEQYEEIDEEDEQLLAQKNELEQQISELQNQANEWSPEQRAISGVVVALNHNGRINIEYGLVKAENKPVSSGKKDVADNHSVKSEKPEFSAALLRDLSQHRSAALRIELANNQDIAFIALIYALVSSVLYHGMAGNCLKISVSSTCLFSSEEAENIPALKAMAVKREKLNFPENTAQLWDFLNKRSKAELDEILAYCVALSVDAVEGERRQGYIKHSQQLAESLQLDMRKWFTATAENSFSRISRNQILQAYRETTGEEPSATLLNLKKKDLAIRAEREIGDKWLPSLFRQA